MYDIILCIVDVSVRKYTSKPNVDDSLCDKNTNAGKKY